MDPGLPDTTYSNADLVQLGCGVPVYTSICFGTLHCQTQAVLLTLSHISERYGIVPGCAEIAGYLVALLRGNSRARDTMARIQARSMRIANLGYGEELNNVSQVSYRCTTAISWRRDWPDMLARHVA